VCGSLTAQFGPRNYTKSDGTAGSVFNVTLSDSTGTIRAVAFDEDIVNLRDEAMLGQVMVILMRGRG
jgi:hypothetical protein